MQYLLIAQDHNDAGALERRMEARPAHLALGDELVTKGQLLYATAILNEEGKMVGSMEVLDLESMDAVEQYLDSEPYVTAKVWNRDAIDIRPCRPGPAFLNSPAPASA